MKVILFSILFFFIFKSFALAQTSRNIDIWSDGTRMSGNIFFPKDFDINSSNPAILMTHGWGGKRKDLNKYYVSNFVKAGFIVMTFDYRGWEDSDSRLVTIGEQPNFKINMEALVKVKVIREVVDPIDQTRDIISALDYLSGEPGVDVTKIGLWGTSYSGGHVIYVAAQDERVSAIYSQVSFQGIGLIDSGELSKKRAIQKARGEIDPIPSGLDKIPNLDGSPDFAKMYNYIPLNWAKNVTVPTLIVDVNSEELFDRVKNGRAAYEIIKNNAIAEYKLFDGSHYDIYYKYFYDTNKLAVECFTRHLMTN